MSVEHLATARNETARAIGILENVVAQLIAGGAEHEAIELSRTISILEMDRRLIRMAHREVRDQASKAGA